MYSLPEICLEPDLKAAFQEVLLSAFKGLFPS
jgi:hypothetical protein